MSKDTYTIIAVADVHMSNKLPYSVPTENGRTNRLEDQMRLWEDIGTAAKNRNVDAVLVLGDLFDKSLVDAVTLTATVEAIISIPCPVWILPGNHDASTVTGGRYVVEAFSAMKKKGVHYFGHEPYYVNDWLTFYPVPFSTPDVAMATIKGFQNEILGCTNNKIDVLFLHHSVIGCTSLGWVCDQGLEADSFCDAFHRVYAGHFHRHQRFGSDGQGMYLGSPMHHSFRDAGTPAQYWLVEFYQDGKVQEYPLVSSMPRFHSEKLDAKDVSPSPADVMVDSCTAAPGDYLRWEVSATQQEYIKVVPPMNECVAAAKKDGVHASFKIKLIKPSGKILECRLGEKPSTMEHYVTEYFKSVYSGTLTDQKQRDEACQIGLDILSEAKNAE